VSADLSGIVLLDKPLGLTSAAAVARLKRLFNARKAGHTGSLDPLASGFLGVCFGEATKFGAHLLDADKSYRVGVRLGERTASGDLETEVCERAPVPELSAAAVAASLASFPKEYDQMPPMHSALKQGGKPLYSYARAGITLERVPRRISIYSMQLLEWASPRLRFDVRCSKGTYIRVLADDIALRLATIGHLVELRRLSVAPFENSPMHTLEELENMDYARRLEAVLPVDAALQNHARLELTAAEAQDLRLGRNPRLAPQAAGVVRIYGPNAEFLGLGELEQTGRLVPQRLIAADPANRA